jgi:hypothetical protein
LVLEVEDDLERSVGITLVHLMWLEICDHEEMSGSVGNRESVISIVKGPEAQIARHLPMVAAKNGTAELLMKIRVARDMFARAQPLLGPEISAPPLPAPARPSSTARPPEMM